MNVTATIIPARHPMISEASGLCWDRGGLWIHNDSGDTAHLWWWRPDATPVEWRLPGAPACDWEDVCIGPSPREPRVAWLWIADTGSARPPGAPKTLIGCPLPADQSTGGTLAWETFPYRVAGMADCEAIFASWTSGLYCIAKDHRPTAGVWHLPIAGSTIRPRHVADIPISVVTAADMTADGSRLAIRNYVELDVWNRRPGETTIGMLLRAPDAEIIDHAGAESIAWEGVDRWWTITEGVDSRLKRWAAA